MPLSTCIFLNLNTLCLFVLCFVSIATQDRDKATTFVLTLWFAASTFMSANAWSLYTAY